MAFKVVSKEPRSRASLAQPLLGMVEDGIDWILLDRGGVCDAPDHGRPSRLEAGTEVMIVFLEGS